VFTAAAKRLAACATIGFTAAAVAGALLTVRDWQAAWPLLGFHAVLMINTYYSVRCFTSIAPRPNGAQIAADGVMVVLYVVLAFQFGDATRYLCASIALFLAATIKYGLMMWDAPGHTRLLTGKIVLNLLAAATCGVALGGVAVGLSQSLPWWFVVFCLANIYILLLSKLYLPVADQSPSATGS
jgi:hypothetical protein